MRWGSLETRQSRLIARIKFEQHFDSGNRHELGLLRSDRRRQRDRDAAAFNQRQHERDRIWRKIRFDGCDCSGRDPIFPQIAAPMIRPVQKFAVCETLVVPYDRLGLRILAEHLEEKINEHQTPPRKMTWPVTKSIAGCTKQSMACSTSRDSP